MTTEEPHPDDGAARAAAPRWVGVLGPLALLVATLVAYAPAFGAEFVDYDDGAYVTQNPDVAGGLTLDGLRWAFTVAHSGNWHPLTWLSHMLDVSLFGLEPAGHHAMAVGLHLVNVALCFAAFRVLLRSDLKALGVAALFALHPLRVESVAWVSERKDVLSGVFFFLSLWGWARYARGGARRDYLLSLLALSAQ